MNLGEDVLNAGENSLTKLMSLRSGYEGINTANDVNSKFGLSKTSDIFTPLKRALASQASGNRRAAAFRSGRSASPGMTFSSIDESYSNALAQLLGQEGQNKQSMEQFRAGLLDKSIGSKDSFNLNQSVSSGNLATGLAGARLNQAGLKDQLESSPGFMDFVGTLLGAASNPVAAMLGGSGSKNTNSKGTN